MQIGIDLENYQTPIEEWDNIVSAYGQDREIGYLKMNPERIPVIVSESKAREEIARLGKHALEFRIKDICYEMVIDDRGALIPSSPDGNLIVFGNIYISRKQWNSNVALTMAEIDDLLQYFEENDDLEPVDNPLDYVGCLAFKYDEKKRCYL